MNYRPAADTWMLNEFAADNCLQSEVVSVAGIIATFNAAVLYILDFIGSNNSACKGKKAFFRMYFFPNFPHHSSDH